MTGEGRADEDAKAPREDEDASTREPLGRLRDRVIDDDDGTPPAAFPESATAAADGDAESGGTEATASDDATANDDDATANDIDATASDGDLVPSDDVDRSGPLGDIAADVEGRRKRKTPADDELFDQMDVGEVDSDELWAQVESDDPIVEGRGGREIREVEKHKYCSRCPYFAEPPDVGCSHEGTDIIEQVDMDHFEVADCPVVLEDERLEDVTKE